MAEAANSQPFCHLHRPGIGVGGACIPVYPLFLMDVAEDLGVNMDLTRAARRINSLMPRYTAELTMQMASRLELEKPRVAVLGLAFRGGVDDTRLSPTYDLINALVKAEIESIVVTDPYVLKDPLLEELGFRLTMDLDEALSDADIAIIATDHPEYRGITLQYLRDKMHKERIGVIDGRHVVKDWRHPPRGVAYLGIGRPFKANIQN